MWLRWGEEWEGGGGGRSRWLKVIKVPPVTSWTTQASMWTLVPT